MKEKGQKQGKVKDEKEIKEKGNQQGKVKDEREIKEKGGHRKKRELMLIIYSWHVQDSVWEMLYSLLYNYYIMSS